MFQARSIYIDHFDNLTRHPANISLSLLFFPYESPVMIIAEPFQIVCKQFLTSILQATHWEIHQIILVFIRLPHNLLASKTNQHLLNGKTQNQPKGSET